MKTLLIILCAIPILAGMVGANLFGFRRLYRPHELSVNLESILEILTTKYPKLNYEFRKQAWAGTPLTNQGVAIVEEKFRHSKSSKDVARQLIRVGLSGLWADHEKLIKSRVKFVKMGYILPPLTILGAVLGTVVGRVPGMWAIVLVGLAIAGCICFLWLSRAVENEAAAQIIKLIERARPLNRLSEEEALIDSIQAWTWVHILPGVAISFMMKEDSTKSSQ